MVITITMKNVRLRQGVYEFRIRVPADCKEAIGKSEITQSLKTADPAKAATLTKQLTSEWKKKFKDIRESVTGHPKIKSTVNDTVVDFKKKIDDHLAQHLVAYLIRRTEGELKESSEWCRECIVCIRDNDQSSLDLMDELGVAYPLPNQKSPGMTRRLNQVLIDALCQIRQAIDDETGKAISKEVDEAVLEHIPTAEKPIDNSPPSASEYTSSGDVIDIFETASLMLDSRNKDGKYRDFVLTEMKYLQEWVGGKSDITSFTKAELVDYIRNCLPYIPKNMQQQEAYKGKSLKECVSMVKSDPDEYVPIAQKTCENRLVAVRAVFNYARNHLGTIRVSPANGVEIPMVRSLTQLQRAFTSSELKIIWEQFVAEAHERVAKYPERYWVTLLGLYHGFRLNEICGLCLKDVYQDEDGIDVIDVNDVGTGKSVKNKASIRIVPVHPYVLNDLGFKQYVEQRKREESNEQSRLFPNLTLVKGAGFGKKVSVWFSKLKTQYLPANSHHKNFHSLRHTFAQQAQNQAKMSDRCSQEITGHSISGVSSIHLGYSGRLKPKDVLEELKKVKYGWE